MKEKLSAYKEIEQRVDLQSDHRIEELKLRIAEIDEEILEIVKGVKDASATVMKYINQNVEELETEKKRIEADIQRLSNNNSSTQEKVVCDFEKFNELSFERKREIANAIIKRIYVTKDKLEIIWNI